MNIQRNISDDYKENLIAKLIYDLPVLRARLGISQAVIAREIGVSRQTYNIIENGKKEMSWTVFMALIAIFNSNEETRKMIEPLDEAMDELFGNLETNENI